MAKKNCLIGIPVLTLVIGLILIGCDIDSDSGDGGDDEDGRGLTWTAVANTTFGNSPINAVAYGGGTFVAVAGEDYEDGKMAYSPDGVTWTAVANTTFGSYRINAVAYGGGKFVAVGNGGKAAYSTDNGVTWTAVANTAFGASNNSIYGIAWGGGKFVAVGRDFKIAYSPDGVTWTAVDSTYDSTIIREAYKILSHVRNPGELLPWERWNRPLHRK
jgi:hypothetical protein